MTQSQLHPNQLALQWPERAIHLFAETFARVFHGHWGTVWLQDPARAHGDLELVGHFGVSQEQSLHLPSHLNLQQLSLAQQGQQGRFIRLMWGSPSGGMDSSHLSSHLGSTELELCHMFGLGTLLCSVFQLEGGTVGVLYAGTRDSFVPEMPHMLEAVQVAQALSLGLQRNRSQQKPDHTSTHLQQILDCSPDMIIICRGLTILSVNPACFEVLGYTPEEMVGRSLTDFMHPEDLERNVRINEGWSMPGRPVSDFRNRYLHKDGHVVHLSWNVTWAGNGNIISIARDITEQVRQEALLQESEARFRAVTDNVPILIWMGDLSKGRTFFNKTWIQFTGKDENHSRGDGWTQFVHPDDLQHYLDTYHQHFQERTPFQIEYRLRRFDGEYRWILATGVPRQGPQGEFLGFIGGCIEMHDRKIAQEALQESERRFKVIADSVPILIWMSDQSKGRTFVNRTWTEFTGKEASASYGTHWTRFVHPDDVNLYLDTYHQHFQERTPFQIEYRLRRFDGEYRWILANCVPRFSPGGEFLGFIGGCIDMHERKMVQERLQQSETQMRELMDVQKRFVADAAHEIRTPLAAIQGNLDILIRYPHIEETEKREIIGDVQREASRLGRLVNDMLTLARGDSGLTFQEQEVQLDLLLLDAWRETERIASQHQMVLGEVQRVSLFGDRDRLKQLALILLENATKYTPAGGTIHMSLVCEDNCAEFRIADTGVGIAPEDLDRVFERFYRADKSRHRGEDPGGTGLGLPIARWIVDQHGGEIWMESEPGAGTTAVVRLSCGEAHREQE